MTSNSKVWLELGLIYAILMGDEGVGEVLKGKRTTFREDKWVLWRIDGRQI